MKRALLVATVIAASTVAGVDNATAHNEQSVYIVRFAKPEVSARATEALAARGRVGNQLTVFPGATVKMSESAAAALRRNSLFASIEKDKPLMPAAVQSNATWGLDRIDQRGLPLDGTFSYGGDGSGVTAYVLDTGIRADHQEFGGRVRSLYTAIDDGNGTNDCNGHGTHVAGTLAGRTYGVAKNASLVNIRVLGCSNGGTVAGLISGINAMVDDHPAGSPAVANISIGAGASDSLDRAINAAVNDGIVVAVAAGNNNADACNYSPARATQALTVGATVQSDHRAGYSNTGRCVDIFAPGSSVVSAYNTSPSATGIMSGTSMATPHVAGAAALVLSAQRGLSPNDVALRLTGNATANLVADAGASPNRLLYIGAATAPAPTPTPPPSTTLPPTTKAPITTTTTRPPTTTTTQPPTASPIKKVPATPTAVSATGGVRQAQIRWNQADASTAEVTGYTIKAYRDGRYSRSMRVPAGSLSTTMKYLYFTGNYTFTVTAHNAHGSSPESARSAPVLITR